MKQPQETDHGTALEIWTVRGVQKLFMHDHRQCRTGKHGECAALRLIRKSWLAGSIQVCTCKCHQTQKPIPEAAP